MTSDEIRSTFLEFFAQRDHLKVPSAPLIPAELDPSALFTVAGMHPLKPYFLGSEKPPHPRATSCQKTFRTADIEIIGTTTRHLTLFEMLGNFSFGDYFKREASRFAWELSEQGFGFDQEQIWITVFGGDEQLGLDADEEAIDAWLELGVPRERIVECPRSENFWQMGPTGPCGPCSELYLDRGLDHGSESDLPGGDNERFLEYWNLVFMEMNLHQDGSLTPLPAKNIDTGLGLNRLASIIQKKPSVFETDQFWPLIELGEELSGRGYDDSEQDHLAMRVLADHGRAMSFLIADGVVPSNEDRGYVLRRIIRRAILRGRHQLGLEPGFLNRYATVVTELMGSEYPELHQQREAVAMWLSSEEESFGRTLEQGTRMLDELIARARENQAEGISAEDAFLLHDTYGFPFDLTLELVTEEGLGVDEAGFEGLMEEQRVRSRARPEPGRDATRERAAALASEAGFQTDFVGYRATEQDTTVGALTPADGRVLAKLVESPFYATGGGQVADSGYLECSDGDCLARVDDVLRLGDDQVLALVPEKGELKLGERVHAHVDRAARHATECNHTATHLLHAALRRRLGSHVRQAGSYVGPDKLRFDFTHGRALTYEELTEVEDEVNRWIAEDQPVRALTTTLTEARRLGAMALFGEKYGDVVRMVEVGDGSFSRELCGGTHVRYTAEIGAFLLTRETASARNVRRIEALTGPAAIELLREHGRVLARAGELLRVPPERVADEVSERRGEPRQKQIDGHGAVDVERLLESAVERDGARVLVAAVTVPNEKSLLELADKLRARLGDAAIVLGAAGEDRVDLVATVAPALVARDLHAGQIVKAAAAAAGGGGGGRDTLARAGSRNPAKLPDALDAARDAIEAALK